MTRPTFAPTEQMARNAWSKCLKIQRYNAAADLDELASEFVRLLGSEVDRRYSETEAIASRQFDEDFEKSALLRGEDPAL